MKQLILVFLLVCAIVMVMPFVAAECDNPRAEWIFCEDFASENWADKWQEVSHTSLKQRDTSRSAVGSASLRLEFPPGGTGAGWMHHWWNAHPDQEEVYLRYYVYYQDGFEWGTNDIKMSGLRGMLPDVRYPPGAGQVPDGTYFNARAVSLSYASRGAEPKEPFLYAYHPNQATVWGDHLHQNLDTKIQLETGKWYCIEIMIEPNTLGHSDGVQRLWIDDLLVAEYTGMYLRDRDDVKIKNLFMSAWQAEGTQSNTQYRWDDGFVVSTSRIGCGTEPADPIEPTPEPEQPEGNVGDVNGDGIVNLQDVLIVLDNIGRSNFYAGADVNGDGRVDILDLILVAQHFGEVYDEAPQEPVDPHDYPYPELSVSQVDNQLAVSVVVDCPDVARWCQVRRVTPTPHVVVIDTSSSPAQAVDDTVTADVTYTYEARYWVDGQDLPREEITLREVTVAEISEEQDFDGDQELSETRPNEPDWGSSGMVFFHHDFSTLPQSTTERIPGSNAGYLRVTRSLGNHYIISETNAPHGQSHSLRRHFPEGMRDGVTGGVWHAKNVDAGFEGQPDMEEWYVSFWFLLEGDEWENPPGGVQKLWYNKAGSTSHVGTSQNLRHAEPPGTSTRDPATGYRHFDQRSHGPTGALSQFAHNVDVRVGQWHFIEQHGRMSDLNQDNGFLRLYLDGELVGEFNNLPNRFDGHERGFFGVHFAPVWGGNCGTTGCPKLKDDWLRVGDFYVSGKPLQE